jgi:hypothetical protein
MSKKNLALSPLFACSLLLTMGALNHQPRAFTPPVSASFVAQIATRDAGMDNLTPAQVLARAAVNLDPERTPWLRVKTWQKQADEEVSFEADGRLVRGPNQCARLEMTIHTGAIATTAITVSDGVGLAHGRRVAGRAPTVTSQRFITPAKTNMAAEEIDRILNAHGCGGPYCLVKELASTLKNLKMVQGTWKGNSVIRLTGTVKEDQAVAEPRFTVPPRICQLYLDARSLWPHRAEWWAFQEDEKNAFLLLELEFRDPVINQPLSHEDCIREFTYQPE